METTQTQLETLTKWPGSPVKKQSVYRLTAQFPVTPRPRCTSHPDHPNITGVNIQFKEIIQTITCTIFLSGFATMRPMNKVSSVLNYNDYTEQKHDDMKVMTYLDVFDIFLEV